MTSTKDSQFERSQWEHIVRRGRKKYIPIRADEEMPLNQLFFSAAYPNTKILSGCPINLFVYFRAPALIGKRQHPPHLSSGFWCSLGSTRDTVEIDVLLPAIKIRELIVVSESFNRRGHRHKFRICWRRRCSPKNRALMWAIFLSSLNREQFPSWLIISDAEIGNRWGFK